MKKNLEELLNKRFKLWNEADNHWLDTNPVPVELQIEIDEAENKIGNIFKDLPNRTKCKERLGYACKYAIRPTIDDEIYCLNYVGDKPKCVDK